MSSKELKKATRNYALKQGVDLIGFVSTRHLNEVIPTRYKPSRLWPEAKTAISVGKSLLLGAIAVGTGEMVQNARWIAWRTNEYLNRRALEIGHFLEQQGFKALPLSNGTMVDPDWTNLGIFGELSHRHVAAEAGLGTIGVPTYIVTPQFGPRVYFNTILTEAELEPDPRLDFNPCGDECDECIRACPNGAITRGRRTIKKAKCIPSAMPHGVRVPWSRASVPLPAAFIAWPPAPWGVDKPKTSGFNHYSSVPVYQCDTEFPNHYESCTD